MDFWDGFFGLLGDLFGEIGILWTSMGLLVMIFIGYGVWYEFLR